MNIILASASPRRQELLHMIYPEFEIKTAKGEENAIFENPSQYVQALAKQKAEEVISNLPKYNSNSTVLISADTIVFSQGKVLGKPHNEKEGFSMLSELSGTSHQVFTGICICVLNNNLLQTQVSFDACTNVHVMSLTEEEINSYIATRDPFDKAGGYGIQGLFGKYIQGIDGDYYNVVGLPVNRLYQELKALSLV